MNEPTHTEAVKTDLPSPKPNRRRRLALRFAVLAAAASALFAAYWFTRPPELVWWRSRMIGKDSHKLRILVPSTWKVHDKDGSVWGDSGQYLTSFVFEPIDNRPRFLRFLTGSTEDGASLTVMLEPRIAQVYLEEEAKGISVSKILGYKYVAQTERCFPVAGFSASIIYDRTYLPAFNRTYRQICNSLTIE